MAIAIINPGTQGRPEATLENAWKIVEQMQKDLGLPSWTIARDPKTDEKDRGYFGFYLRAGKIVEISVPGDDPDEVCAGKPFVSRRLYVDGNSWVYGRALGIISRRMGRS